MNTEPDNDLMMMARFLVLPGARRLLYVYGEIPEGPIRESLIAHGEALAAAFRGAPAQYQAPDPLNVLSGPAPRVPERGPSASVALEPPGGRKPREPKLDSIESQIVAERMKGRHPRDIATSFKVPLYKVHEACREARLAGAGLPPLGTRKRHNTAPAVRFVLHPEQLSGQGLKQMQAAAGRRGISVEDYLGRRRLAIDIAVEGGDWQRILAATGEQQNVVSAWFTTARAAGIQIPYPYSNPTVEVEDIPTVFPALDAYSANGISAIRRAAERRGMTPQAYLDLRESIVRHRKSGLQPLEISRLTGQKEYFVKDTLDRAKELGVRFATATPAKELNGVAHA